MAKFQEYQDKQGMWRWRLIADNGQIMADSAEGYDSQENVKRAQARFVELAKDAEVEEVKENEDGGQ